MLSCRLEFRFDRDVSLETLAVDAKGSSCSYWTATLNVVKQSLALAVNLLAHTTAPPRLVASSALPSAEPSLREFLNYLVLFVRPPPLPTQAFC
jgi:hypothetical protein